MNEQKKRLQTILLSFKGNQREFGDTIGKSKQTISGWLSGRFPIPEDAAITIEMVHGYRREWLLEGKLPEKVALRAKMKIEFEPTLLKKITSKEGLPKMVEILAILPKKEFEIAQKLIFSLAKKEVENN
ncbi:putative bacteriophage CI repressor protein [Leptospira weilii str. 2006001853]|uniref:Putative bacteriophage CI repressor protein n=2 Tax=Leptospira weilii TaxID=28184 RepID=A0A828Z6J6_9LEPT|nr:transcriptional regulator [Leptospira weilii]EMM74255.1 putative bacteriophage CI repressor protein [Leptospira weilii str. 2006001855]EKR66678.1 putative bacteriophage CI repressor protein [Leptospira weilii str. 2006001853]EMN45992.1 putative bacteriophage CI repressor protein [Leptospira weilii str. LNT 1234]MCL8268124.1 transcriptional regulator [Leptospira weilii]QDK21626.1 transcriptional regulator [Leptospira weilii]